MILDDIKIKEILLKENYVSEDDIQTAEDFSKSHNTSISDYLLSKNIITKDLIGQAIAESFKVSYTNLKSKQPLKEQILKIPESVARKFNIILFKEDGKNITIVTDNPLKKGLSTQLKKLFPKSKISVTYSLTEDILEIFVSYQKELKTRFSKIIKSGEHIAPDILEEIFEDAYTFYASDIHFEPQGEEVIIRFRIDGVLQEAGRLSKIYYENILNRIKIKSQLRIDEHLTAQDGSMSYSNAEIKFDLRTSIIPTIEGEKVVLRVLTAYVKGITFDSLGLSTHNQQMLEEAAHKPFGMILVTGPTGSGKTTTLYSALKLLHKPGVNITTIEDPVEYKVAGVNQIQVNKQTELTFARGLRSIVRQDPDIILVGEIRDEETAETAVNAALTGHLLLSTFHANDAATSIPRLIDMGIEPFLLASTIEVIIAQRLVRKICNTCRYSLSITKKELEKKYPQAKDFLTGSETTLYAGKGCSACGDSGYKGRTAIFEFIKITQSLQDLIIKSPSTREIWKLAHEEGAQSLFADGINKVRGGITTIEELLRVAPPPLKDK